MKFTKEQKLAMAREHVDDYIPHVDTLKCYEEGRRTLPFNIYYKLIQLFEFDIGVIKTKS